MQTLSASEIKRRGIIAVEEMLRHGPIYILRNSRTACVAMSAEDFSRLTARRGDRNAPGAWELLLAPAGKGKATRRKVDARLKAERDAWDK